VENYVKEALIGTLVLCVVNFPHRQIGPFISEVLTLGVPDQHNKVVLVRPEREVPVGGKLY
jgi:tRNA-binding protein